MVDREDSKKKQSRLVKQIVKRHYMPVTSAGNVESTLHNYSVSEQSEIDAIECMDEKSQQNSNIHDETVQCNYVNNIHSAEWTFDDAPITNDASMNCVENISDAESVIEIDISNDMNPDGNKRTRDFPFDKK